MTMFLPGVPEAYVLGRIQLAAGNELESGKLLSPASSSALAVNTFGWFNPRPHLLPALHEQQLQARRVEVEYCARFPWRGGTHPWLDAAIFTHDELIGIESKRFEPYRDAKTVRLSSAYDRKVWGAGMESFERLRDNLKSGVLRFKYLDAAQLLKHAFGLVTDARRHDVRPRLVYLFAEPATVSAETKNLHRAEINEMATMVRGADVAFSAISYREWLSAWPEQEPSVFAHGQAILDTFAP
jgi:hypothetical protein